MQRLAWTSMLFPDYRPAVFDDIRVTVIVTMEPEGTEFRCVLAALHRNEPDPATNQAYGWQDGTESSVDLFAAHIAYLK